MKNNLTEMVFVLDRSGSMYRLEEDTIGGFNSMISSQKEKEGDANVTTVLFNHGYKLLHDRFDLKDVAPLTSRDYHAGGSTALLDALGSSIQKTINVQKHLPKESRADNVVFVIITDGMENASCEYSYRDIKKMIKKQQEKYGWEFIFMGANIDAVEEASRMGIRSNRAVNYHATPMGTNTVYENVDRVMACARCESLDEDVDYFVEMRAEFERNNN